MRRGALLALAVLAGTALPAAADESHRVQAAQRLSAWLRQQPPLVDPLGLVWTTPQALAEQRDAQTELLRALDDLARHGRLSPESATRLQRWVDAMPATGRVRLPAVDPDWLEANPRRDPLLAAGDGLRAHGESLAVRVLTDEPRACDVPHKPGLRARDYVLACFDATLERAWVVQPDGRLQHVGVAAWNQSVQDEPAAGAWIWAPRNARLPEAFHRQWAQWLAWQGPSNAVPSQRLPPGTQREPPEPQTPGHFDFQGRGLEPRPTSSDWGNVGLLQTPTARMRPEGSFWIHLHDVSPYRQGAVMLQPLPWLETGFRYVSIRNRLYGAADFSGAQSYKDKSIDLKLRLLEEGARLPALAVGWRDMGGTGLFSGEYLVASRRWGRLDASLGMGWGYLGNRAQFSNPLSAVAGDRFKVRENDVGQGGTFGVGSWFRGPTSLFGGLEYQSPWNLDFKVEYDPGNYQREPLGNAFEVRSPLNWGVVYKAARGVELSLGLSRGNRVALGWTLYTDLAGLHMPKVTDPTLPRPRADREQVPPAWKDMARDIERHTQWRVAQILDGQDRVTVQASQSVTPAPRERFDKAAQVMDAHLPSRYEVFTVEHQFAGQPLVAETVARSAWMAQQNQPARSAASAAPPQSVAYEPKPSSGDPRLPENAFKASLDPGLDFIHTLGGPDGFLLYQFSLALRANLTLPTGAELKGTLRQRLLNNYDRFRFGGFSDLPRVRTFLREYFVTSSTTLNNLTLSQSTRVGDHLYAAAYAGLFEEMFGGVGTEALYRRPGSRFALGLDVNHVRQRDFAQDLGFRDYRVTTGHATGYWTTPWEGIHASLAVGQYLAGDRGATLFVNKTFRNGAIMGAFATKTNVPAATFGEGSFDKGIFWAIPFDAFLTSSSRSYANFAWKPLTRDGGAMVIRPVRLFTETEWLNPEAYRYRPAPPPNDRVAPDDRVDAHAGGR
jgi:hypothetical protein